jgi:hypothetical protein
MKKGLQANLFQNNLLPRSNELLRQHIIEFDQLSTVFKPNYLFHKIPRLSILGTDPWILPQFDSCIFSQVTGERDLIYHGEPEKGKRVRPTRRISSSSPACRVK